MPATPRLRTEYWPLFDHEIVPQSPRNASVEAFIPDLNQAVYLRGLIRRGRLGGRASSSALVRDRRLYFPTSFYIADDILKLPPPPRSARYEVRGQLAGQFTPRRGAR